MLNVSGLIKIFALILIINSNQSVKCQIHHYVPAQILIPTLNVSNYYNFPNRTNQTYPYFNSTNNITSSEDGNLIVGSVGYSDRLLFNQIYLKPRRWWTVRESIIEYPKDVPGGYVRYETISSIRIYNQFYDGHGATATISNGGVGKRFVKISLRSQWGRGFKFLVQLYGH